MNPEVKALWVAALRSGDYEQGYGYLRQGDEFCCLGVLCDIAVDNKVIPVPDLDAPIVKYDEGDDDSDVVLPAAVQSWAGVDMGALAVYVALPNNNFKSDALLSFLNDSCSFDFNAIADLIEEQL